MDALMAAIVAGCLAQIGDRTAWLAAILADRTGRPLIVLVAGGLALLAAGGIAVAGGMILAPLLTPEAKLLMLALALGFQGMGGFGRVKSPDRLDGWRIGAFLTSLLGLFILAFGDGVQFIVVTLAARSPIPWLAAIGATIGSLAVMIPAAVLGEAAWIRLPLVWPRRIIGTLFLLAALILALQALRLI